MAAVTPRRARMAGGAPSSNPTSPSQAAARVALAGAGPSACAGSPPGSPAVSSDWRSAAGVPAPRDSALRSRVMLQRTEDGGVWGVTLPADVLPAAHLFSARGPLGGGDAHGIKKSTCLVGEGALQTPLELVKRPPQDSHALLMSRIKKQSPKESGSRRTAAREAPREWAAPPASGKHQVVKLTQEVRVVLKDKLEGLNNACTANFLEKPRSLGFFLRELHEICGLLQARLADKSYRKGYASRPLHHLVRLIPALSAGAELPPEKEDLPQSEFLPVTVLLALSRIPWEFRYNKVLHCICNCTEMFPDAPGCVCPAQEPGTGGRHSAPPPPAHDSAGADESALGSLATAMEREARERDARIEALQRRERHFPERILKLADSLRKRFVHFARQAPGLLEDFKSIAERSSGATGLAGQTAGMVGEGYHSWDRYAPHLLSEICVLDSYYTQFEQLYLGLVRCLIGAAVAPVRGLAEPSGTLLRGLDAPFREVEAAVLCQRLGQLTKQVNFGASHTAMHFDPALLGKARRVLAMSTYPEVHRLAQDMLDKFRSLCRALSESTEDTMRPELADNSALRHALLALQPVWVECGLLLQQVTLDFVQRLLDFLRGPKVPEILRWQLRVAALEEADDGLINGTWKIISSQEMVRIQRRVIQGTNFEWRLAFDEGSSEHFTATASDEKFTAKLSGDKIQWSDGEAWTREASLSADELRWARVALFETLPVLMYLDELEGDINHERSTGGGFSEHFCDPDDRNLTLRHEMAKRFNDDSDRWLKFNQFVLEEAGFDDNPPDETDQDGYLRLLYRQTRDLVSFSTDQGAWTVLRQASSPDAADEEVNQLAGRKRRIVPEARWICVLRVALADYPELFPAEAPADTATTKRRKSVETSRRGSGGAARQRSSFADFASPAKRSSQAGEVAARSSAAAAPSKRPAGIGAIAE